VTTKVNGSADTVINPASLDVCSWGNGYSGSDCVAVSENEPPTTYNQEASDVDIEDDWAVLELDALLPSTTFDQDLSDLSLVGSRQMNSFGFPGLHPNFPGTNPDDCDPNVKTAIDSNFDAGWLYSQDNVDMTDFSGAIAKMKMDAMVGQSGSPVFHCSGSDDVCDVGEKGVVDVVLAGFADGLTTDRWIGPRVPAIRDEILAEIED
jgi:hypothetical protein